MVSEGGEDVAHHAGAGPGVEDRWSVAGLHVAAKEPGCNRRGSVPPAQHAPLVILRPGVVELRSLLAVTSTVRTLQALRPIGIAQTTPPGYSWGCPNAQLAMLKHPLHTTLQRQILQRLQQRSDKRQYRRR